MIVMSIIVFTPLKQKTARTTWKRLQTWFDEHPDRKTCNTSVGKIRRSHMKRDFLKFCEHGIKL